MTSAPGEGGSPPGLNSAILESIHQTSNNGAGNGLPSTGQGFGANIGSQNTIDGFAQSSNLDANVSLGSVEDLKGFFGTGAFDDNLFSVFDGTVLSHGNLDYSQSLAANNLGWGSIEAGQAFTPGNNLNAKMPRLSTKGQQQVG